MSKYQAFHPSNEVRGQLMLAFLSCTEHEDILPFLEKHHLTNIQPEQWYPEQPWVDILNDLVAAGNAMFNFVSIGMKMAELVPLPPNAESMAFKDLIVLWGKLGDRESMYRGPDYGWRQVRLVDDNHAEVSFRYASPDDMMYGFIYGYCRRSLPKGTLFTVKYDENLQRCDDGGPKTVVHVRWDNPAAGD